jgi:very-short-patch-repair endonuclease
MAALTSELEEPLDVRQLFTYAQGLAAGLRPAELRSKDYRPVIHGVYIHASVPRRPFERVEAALFVHRHDPRAYASHVSAARVYEVPLPERLSDEHVTVFHKQDRRRRRGVCPHLAPPSGLVITLYGIRVSAPAQVFLELASLLNLVELVVVGDALVKQGRVSPEALVEAARTFSGTGAVLARRAASYVRAGVDSPMESRLRMMIVLAGLAEPTVALRINYPDGRLRYRLDLSYPELKLAVEYDGRQHAEDTTQWEGDVERDYWFENNGWMKVKVLAAGVFKRPEHTLMRIRAALLKRGGRVPRRLRTEWQPFFPVRG